MLLGAVVDDGDRDRFAIVDLLGATTRALISVMRAGPARESLILTPAGLTTVIEEPLPPGDLIVDLRIDEPTSSIGSP